jgi:hypothetical protein
MQHSSRSTRLCEIVTVVIRILALHFGLYTFNYILTTIGRFQTIPFPRSDLFIAAVMAVCVFWLWHLSPFFARRITRGHDTLLDCGSLTLSDLYSFAFLLVGLYFAVASFGPTLTWLHYSVRESSGAAALSPEQKTNFYTLFKFAVKLLLGLALVFNARKLANRLIKRQNETA